MGGNVQVKDWQARSLSRLSVSLRLRSNQDQIRTRAPPTSPDFASARVQLRL
jgi:hypothetical protein